MTITYDTARIGCWLFVHTRAYDTVHFGPFPTYEELLEWLDTTGKGYGASGIAVPVVSPSSEPARFWDKLYSIAEE